MKLADLKLKRAIDFYLGCVLLFVLKPLTIVIGKIMRRDHSLVIRDEVVFLKLLGGGSLVIAFPAILGIKNKFPTARISLLTTPSIEPFARALGVFDRIILIDDRSLSKFMVSALIAWASCFKVDTIIDLEVYSRLSTVFSLITMARNRIGFYLENIFWRKNINTHLVFFNRYSGIFFFYEQIAYLLGAEPSTINECRKNVVSQLPNRAATSSSDYVISVGHGCSGLAPERMLTLDQWLQVFKDRLVNQDRNHIVSFYGSRGEWEKAEEIIQKLSSHFPGVRFNNRCGFKFNEVLSQINSSNEFWGIDSGLLHISRLLGKKTVSFWGPTSPFTYLKPMNELNEEIIYDKIPCSPCVHVAESPPCGGNNICIKRLFDKSCKVDGKNSLFTAWIERS